MQKCDRIQRKMTENQQNYPLFLTTEQEFELVKQEKQFSNLTHEEKTEIYIGMLRIFMVKENFWKREITRSL